jgi:hypothetical protein
MSHSLWEVIVRKKRKAYGLTFTDFELAERYANHMLAIGYTVDEFPEYPTIDTYQDARDDARAFFCDMAI